jgi:uncharacterized protein
MQQRKKVWIDIDNSPHVPFFLPIIEKLREQDVELVLTARNMYQVRELLDFFQLRCKMVGGHYGKNKVLKVMGTFLRTAELVPTALKMRPDLAISHGSRAQMLASKIVGIPSMMLHDYEFSTKTGFLEPDWVLMPEVIPGELMSKNGSQVLKYPGIKEDVYVPGFRPDASILTQLGIAKDHLLVTVRPPATEAHYHNPESEVLFAETLRRLGSIENLRIVTLPRNGRQGQQLLSEWSELIASGRMIIPSKPVDGVNLVWFSDLVVSGGGTMNREAAALGVPVYSIFRGKIGAVDRYLESQGRMVMIENVEDVHTKIRLERWNRPAQPESHDRQALQFILASIMSALGAGECGQPVRSQLPNQSEPSNLDVKIKDAKIRHRRPPVPASEEVS